MWEPLLPLRDKSAYLWDQRSKIWHENVVAIDGEGWDVDDKGRQLYKLMVAADIYGRSWHLYNPDGIKAEDAFNWLLGLPYAHYTSYSFTYDITQLLRTIPDDKVQTKLCDNERTGYVHWGSWAIDWRRGKYFRIKHAGIKFPFTIWDAYPFYQKSLIGAIESSQIECPDMDIIREGKERRGDEEQHSLDLELPYATAECVMLARMQQSTFNDIEKIGINISSFYGPGTVAEAKMRQEGVGAFLAPIDPRWAEAAKIAYAGGRFETLGHGYRDFVWQYDLNSAYPAALLRVPCLMHCSWERTGSNVTELSLIHVKWKLRSGNWGPFPVHFNGHHGLHFPFEGDTWVWGWEFIAAQLLDVDLEVVESVTPIPSCDHKPFPFISRAYSTRQRMKAVGNGLEKVYKLWLNSLYGKTAQSIGTPAFASPVWAGMITSWTRAQLLRQIASGHVIATATDGILTDEPLTLRESTELGEWGEPKMYSNVLMLQPGVWHAQGYSRTRGCHANEMDWQLARNVFDGLSVERADARKIAGTYIPVPDHSQFITLTQANAEGALERAGVWKKGNHRFRYYSSKRPDVQWINDEWFNSYPGD